MLPNSRRGSYSQGGLNHRQEKIAQTSNSQVSQETHLKSNHWLKGQSITSLLTLSILS